MDGYFDTAYRSLRRSAYRNKYEKALICGRSLTFGGLLANTEYAYNIFRQMGVEPEEPVCLCLPNCPELLFAFYGLSRLGAIAVLAHPASSPRELRAQMDMTGAQRLITTPGRYRSYRALFPALPPGHLILCGSAKDDKDAEFPAEVFFDRLLRENRYSANEAPYSKKQPYATYVFGSSCFLHARSIAYSPDALQEAVGAFWHRRETVRSVYIEPSFASEGGLLAAHSALCTGRCVIWSAGEDPFGVLTRRKPDFLIASEEFFWEFRQWADEVRGGWRGLQGGIQIGKPLTPLMEKFAARAFAAAGGHGALSACPVPLQVRREPLVFLRDFGVRTADIEQLLREVEGVAQCRCCGDGDQLRLIVTLRAGADPQTVGRALIARCRSEMGAPLVPQRIEFRTASL